MAGKTNPLYWDACMFLAWIKKETCWPKDVMDGIQQTVDEWQDGKLVIVTSSITMLEVLSAELTIEQKDGLEKAFSHQRLQLYDVNRRIAGKASVIRQHYDDRVFGVDGSPKSGRVIGMGDSIHLATALYIEAREFQTLDGAGGRQRKFNLLSLDGNVAGARLAIKLPKFVPPPVFSVQPIAPVAGEQGSLALEFSESPAPDSEQNATKKADSLDDAGKSKPNDKFVIADGVERPETHTEEVELVRSKIIDTGEA